MARKKEWNEPNNEVNREKYGYGPVIGTTIILELAERENEISKTEVANNSSVRVREDIKSTELAEGMVIAVENSSKEKVESSNTDRGE